MFGWNLTLLGSGHITCVKHTSCRVYSRLLLMMGHRRCPKHVEFYDRINFWIFDASSWLFYTKLVMMHSHLNIMDL
jgi:hypothetical protein